MSLTLSGCLGRAQLGAAELGGFQTLTTGAGFPLFFPDVGPVKQAEAPKKKTTKRKKKKQAKKGKKQRPLALTAARPVESASCSTADARSGKTQEPKFILPELILGKSVDTAAQRLRETITEEDELLLLIC